jgi:hypothetical protein
MSALHELSRRRVLRGMMGGAAVTVGLPFLDCFLNTTGTALADGTALPVCFGSWFAGLGLAPGFWEPKIVGAKYEMPKQLTQLTPYRDRINIFSGMQAMLDGKPNSAHTTGPQACLSGDIPRGAAPIAPTMDSIIADAVGARTRFRSLEVSCDGSRQSYSLRGGAVMNPSEVSPAALYARVFGPEFRDPNAAEFTPDPKILARRSALSVVREERESVLKSLGAADRIRLEEYFTSLRDLEQQLELALQKPAPLAACTVPNKIEEATPGAEINAAMANHTLFAKLLTHALACGQTQVVNVLFTVSNSILRKAGSVQTFHMYTHEESLDPALGYQPTVWWFQEHVVNAYAEMLKTLDSVREGDGSLLDRCLILYSTDGGSARVHSTDNIPMFTAGGAGGRIKTGMHIRAQGDTVARVGLTLQQVMGVPTGSWGTDSNRTSKTFSEIMV